MMDFFDDKKDEDFFRKEKRFKEFSYFLEQYKKNYYHEKHVEIKIIENAGELITCLYFEWLEKHVRPFVPKRINKSMSLS